MIPLIKRELVERRGWLEESEFVDLLAIAQSGPGPIAVNTATVTGYRIRGSAGALAAVLGASMPSFLVILAFASVLTRYKNAPAIDAVFRGMRPAILGLLAAALWQVGKSSVRERSDLWYVATGAFLLFVLGQGPVTAVFVSGLLGAIAGYVTRRRTRGTEEGGATGKTEVLSKNQGSDENPNSVREGNLGGSQDSK